MRYLPKVEKAYDDEFALVAPNVRQMHAVIVVLSARVQLKFDTIHLFLIPQRINIYSSVSLILIPFRRKSMELSLLEQRPFDHLQPRLTIYNLAWLLAASFGHLPPSLAISSLALTFTACSFASCS